MKFETKFSIFFLVLMILLVSCFIWIYYGSSNIPNETEEHINEDLERMNNFSYKTIRCNMSFEFIENSGGILYSEDTYKIKQVCQEVNDSSFTGSGKQ